MLPNADQRQMARAVARALGSRLRSWREGDAPPPWTSPAGEREPRVRSFWGWGYEGEGPDALQVEVLLEFLKERFGLPGYDERPAPREDEIELRAPRYVLPERFEGVATSARRDRLTHSFGKSLRDILRGLDGAYDNPTDYVAYPTSEEQLESLMSFCAAEGVALVPFGGGSSVVGGVEPTCSGAYAGTLTVDMRHFDRVVDVDVHSRVARVQAGIYGPALEEALKPYGLSPRFYPQSFEFSTLGGWIATRAGGHYCTLYTHIDDILEAVRVVTPRGAHETRRLPASGAGPSQERLWLGSEGTLGIITEATIRLHARPRYRSSTTVKFDTFERGAEAVRALSQSKLYPVNCRLVSALEAVAMGLGDGKHAMLLLGFESELYPQKRELERAVAVCRANGGRTSARRAVHTEAKAVRKGSAGSWRRNFIKAPYLRDILARRGLISETFETAVTWDRFPRFHAAVQAAAQRIFDERCEGRGLITCRFTHVYPDGPAPYYSVIAWAPPGQQLETWDAIKASVSDAIFEEGGTITHHHAVGRDHRPWYERERGELFTETLRGLKSTLDPAWVLNPGILLSEDEAERARDGVGGAEEGKRKKKKRG